MASTARSQGLPRALLPSVEEIAVNPSPQMRTPGIDATVASERTKEGVMVEDATAEEATTVEASAKRVSTEQAATGAAVEEAVTKAAEDATTVAEGWRSFVAARGR